MHLAFDGLDRMTRVEHQGQPGGASVLEVRADLAYNAAGQFTGIQRYKDTDGGAANLVVDTSFGYDGIGRLISLDHFKESTTFAAYDWTFDAFSRLTSYAFAHLVGGSGSSNYSYDNTSQLTAADHSNQADEAYSFDSAGNRTNAGYVTGDNNRTLSDGVYNYTHDDEGNRLTRTHIGSRQVDEYAWDHRNRLTGVTTRASAGGAIIQTVLYVYDALDRRIEKS